MASKDEVLIKIRMQGGKAAASDIRSARREIDSLGPAGSRASGGLAAVGSAASNIGTQAMTAAGRVAKLATAAGGIAGAGMAVQAAKTGAAYNKMQDSQMVAFSTMLKSESAAKTLMQDIQDLALKSPVLDPGSTGAAVQRLLNFGVSVKQVLPLVEALGDASSASGKSVAEVMPQAALAIGQIAGKGKLQAEELNQLTEAVGINRKLLAKELGMTSEEFADSFTPGNSISADKAIPAIQRALLANSEGAAEKLSKTTAGQVDRLREVIAKELGDVTRPWYDAAGDTAGGIGDILGQNNISGGQKIRLSVEVAKKEFGPLIRNAREAFDEANVGQEIADGIEEWTPRIIDKLATGLVNGAPGAAAAFLRAFTSMGPWGQALTVAFLMKKFGAFGPAGRLLGRTLGVNAGAAAVDATAAGLNKDGAITGKSKGRMTAVGRSLGGAMGIAMGAMALNEFASQFDAGVQDIWRKFREGVNGTGMPGTDPGFQPGSNATPANRNRSKREQESPEADLHAKKDLAWNSYLKTGSPGFLAEYKRLEAQIKKSEQARRRSTGGRTRPGELTMVGERGPELARFPTGTQITPTGQVNREVRRSERTQIIREQPINVYIDGKQTYHAVSRQTEIRELAR